MKKMFYIFIILCTFLSVTDTKAEECRYSELKDLKSLARKIEVLYTPIVSNDKKSASFSLEAYNLDSKFYLKVQDMMIINYSRKNMNIGNYEPGNKIKIFVYASRRTNCIDERLYNFEVILPYYNKYSSYDECLNNNKNICRKWYDTSSISEEEFKELMKESNKTQSSGLISQILLFLKTDILWISIGIVIIALITIVIIIHNKKRVKIKI